MNFVYKSFFFVWLFFQQSLQAEFVIRSRQIDIDPTISASTVPNIDIDPTLSPTSPTVSPTAPTVTPTTPTLSPTVPTVSPTVPTGPTVSPGQIIQLLPGSKLTLNSGDIYQVSSSNFGSSNYASGETSTWIFLANQCVLSASCPCVDIPPAWNCLDNYLKVKTGLLYDVQKFCGGNKPGQRIVSDSGEVFVRFRAGSQTAKGFTCFVSCTGSGQPVTQLPGVNCPGPN